jgi:hypothetical protein
MGLLSLHHAHKEQRDEREMDKSWGPRVLVGIYVGCIMNHKEATYEFLVHDGMRIRSTTANLRKVGDCFPFNGAMLAKLVYYSTENVFSSLFFSFF